MKVYEAVGETLKKLGVKVVFNLIGDGNLRFINHMVCKLAITHYAARHEAGAVCMADGYSRTTGEVGVCSVTQGPGVTNTLTALNDAVQAGTPLLFLTGDPHALILRDNQDLDEVSIFNSIGVGVQRLRHPSTIFEDITIAYNRAVAEQRPIAMCLPLDLQDQTIDPQPLLKIAKQEIPKFVPPENVIEQVIEMIQTAKRPVILAGRGAVRSGALEPLEQLGDRIGALFATTAQALGLFTGTEYYVGISGGFAGEFAVKLLSQADLVLAFGARLTHWTTRNQELYPHARFVQCDINAGVLAATNPLGLSVAGDARLTARALVSALDARHYRSSGYRTSQLAKDIASYQLPFTDASTNETIDPRKLLLTLESMLPKDRTIVTDVGRFLEWCNCISSSDGRGWINSLDSQCIGLGLGKAFGAAIGRPNKLVVHIAGDGGFIMNLHELETIVRYQLPMLICIINDSSYGPEVNALLAMGQAVDLVLFPDVDIAAIARGIGGQGITVRRAEDLEKAQTWLQKPTGLMLLDCKVNPLVGTEEVSKINWYERMIHPSKNT